MRYYVYIVRCFDGYLYTGITGNLKKRACQHKKGLDRNTKNRRPVRLVYTECFATRTEAAKREREIKGWSRKKKEELINSLL